MSSAEIFDFTLRLVSRIRPSWDRAEIASALAGCAGRDAEEVRDVAVAAARDPRVRRPAVIAHPSQWPVGE